jgi:hypothetical protein
MLGESGPKSITSNGTGTLPNKNPETLLNEGGKAMKRLLFSLFLATLWVSVVQAENRVQVPLGDSPTLGPADAPVTMIEFIDFQ